MWLRAVAKGALFKKIDGICGLYYRNPKGLSTHVDKQKKHERLQEEARIVKQYRYVWQ